MQKLLFHNKPLSILLKYDFLLPGVQIEGVPSTILNLIIGVLYDALFLGRKLPEGSKTDHYY